MTTFWFISCIITGILLVLASRKIGYFCGELSGAKDGFEKVKAKEKISDWLVCLCLVVIAHLIILTATVVSDIDKELQKLDTRTERIETQMSLSSVDAI